MHSNGHELSPRGKVILFTLTATSALGLAACAEASPTPTRTPTPTPPTPELANQLNPDGQTELCLRIRNLYLEQLGTKENDLTGGQFQSACLEVVPELNDSTACSTKANAEKLGFDVVQNSFKNAKLHQQAMHTNARVITDAARKTASKLCNDPRYNYIGIKR